MAKSTHRSVDPPQGPSHRHRSHGHGGRSVSPHNRHSGRSVSPHHHHSGRSVSPHHHHHHHHCHNRDRSASPSGRARHRSTPPHRAEAPRRHRPRSPSPKPSRHSRGHRRLEVLDGRRVRSCGTLGSGNKSVSPLPLRRTSSRRNIVQNLLKLLSTSDAQKIYKDNNIHREERGIRDRRQHHGRNWFSIHRESSSARVPLIGYPIMPHRHAHGHRVSRFHRAREEAAEVERLRKVNRGDVEEAERNRPHVEEQMPAARRTRLQQELDEAELRRVRALEQFNEAERQRREMQIEDRLRQLEEQDPAVDPPPKKASFSKKCCKSFKILFGILLSLGLIFVFYLIVASIMGESPPLDMFNFDISKDPRLVDITANNGLPTSKSDNTTWLNTKANMDTTELVTIIVNDTVVPVIRKNNIGNEEEKNLNEEKKIDQLTEEDHMLEFINGMPIGPRAVDTVSFETYEIVPPYSSDRNYEDFYVQYNDQDPAPSNTGDRSYGLPHGTGNTAVYGDNFPTVRLRTNPFVHRSRTETLPSSPLNTMAGASNNKEFVHDNVDRMEVESQTIVIPEQTFDHQFNLDQRPISTPRSGLSFEGNIEYSDDRFPQKRRSKHDMEQLEQEIIRTLFEIDRNSKRKTKQTERSRLPKRSRQNLYPVRPTTKSTKRRRPATNNSQRSLLKSHKNRSNSYRNVAPKPTLNVKAGRSRAVRPSHYGRPGQQRSTRDQLLSAEDSRRELYNRGRGPRNSDFHEPPPEFRYPRTAGSIQDIIDHMTTEEKQRRSEKAQMTKIRAARGYKVGDQNHVLRPTFVRNKTGYNSRIPSNFQNEQSHKTSKDRPNHFNYEPEHTHSSTESEEYHGHPENHKNLEHIEYGDDLVFHKDGSFSVVSNEKQQTTPKYETTNPTTKAHGYHSQSQSKEHHPPVYTNLMHKPFKVMLDVYPIGNYDKGEYSPKYESRYTIIDDVDANFKTTQREDFHSPEPHEPPEDRLYSDVHSKKVKPESRYEAGERFVNSQTGQRSRTLDPSRDQTYNARNDNDYGRTRYRSQGLDDVPRTHAVDLHIPNHAKLNPKKDGAFHHTITLHINLLSKDPGHDPLYRRSNRKLADLEVENMHEVSLDIPLSRQFTPTDVYNALTRNVQQNRPYAEYLVASREGRTSSEQPQLADIFDAAEGGALLGAIEDALRLLNPSLPPDVQFNITAEDKRTPGQRIIAKNVHDTDFDYSEGFVAKVAKTNEDRTLSQIDVNRMGHYEHREEIGTILPLLYTKNTVSGGTATASSPEP